ncbi:class I SAM-dependent methyltransferase [Massilia sp. Leaf139]|uniref:class I SAM-dependent methyltransferase n=1 Tax=Massilia sp. Leaf139 TaxID=1736272 RepID=UPI0006FE105E|nr:methyltransferase domain-containing protein [Massilia sp. Leaf139]KQQ97611.1 methyltransferase type 11 [Massilia sp. Leaf139]
MLRTRSRNCRTSRTHPRLAILLACLSMLAQPSSASLDTAAQAAATDTRYERVVPSPDGIGKRYMGREIAGVMGWEGAQWLERESRAREERPELLLRELALGPGMTVADIGAGTGYYTWQLAKGVGPGGRVYAVDVQPEMIRMLDRQMAKRGVRNVVSVLGSETSVKLPPASVDLAIMVDVYHELAYPAEVLDSIVAALKPGGRVVFVEYRAEDPAVAIKPLHKMSERQVRREATAHGLKWERSIGSLPIQHAIVFRKP